MSFTLYQRPGSPNWYASITVPGRDRLRTSCRTPIKKRARKFAEAIEQKEWDRRTTGDGKTLTFAEAVMLYRKDGKPTQYLKPLVRYFKNQTIDSIKPGHIKAAAAAIYPGANPATWNRQAVTPARAVINHAAERGLTHNIKVRRFHESRPIRKAPAADWLPAFMAAAPPRIAALALFMRVTAARVGQAIEMEWESVDLSEGIAIVPAAKGHPERRAFLTPECVAALANIEGKRTGRVFGFRSRRRVYDPWRATCEAAGIPYVSTHSAGRRAFATEMARAHIDPKTAADLGGWKSVRIMLDIYTDSAASREVVNRVFSGSMASQKSDIGIPISGKMQGKSK